MRRQDHSSSSDSQSGRGKRARENEVIRFGPYLSDRQWATIREDLSADGSCWESCDFRRSHRDPYIAGEDGLLGVSDEKCRVCFAWGFWNGHDPFVKEKLFGVTGGLRAQGNHGEDVKEAYFYQLNTPDHGYMRAKYMYPSSCPFPYDEIIRVNESRSQQDDEFEIYETEAFKRGFWEIKVEYAAVDGSGETVCLLTAKNCGDTEQTLHVLPTVWFRNTWNTVYAADSKLSEPSAKRSRLAGSKKRPQQPEAGSDDPDGRPTIAKVSGDAASVVARHPELPDLFVRFNADGSAPVSQLLFTRNEVGEKDAISKHLCAKDDADKPSLPQSGTKCSSVHLLTVAPAEQKSVVVVLSTTRSLRPPAFRDLAALVTRQRDSAEEFYTGVLDWLPAGETELSRICQTAYSGLLWSKQYYEYRVAEFQRLRQLAGGAPAAGFKWNPRGWEHLDNADIMSMPDKWEFPWYASWDSSFHAAVLVDIDAAFAKGQIELLLSDRYMSADGQVPGCEFDYSDENPPVMAWASHEIWMATGDTEFARRVYPKLKRNFNWWLQHRRVTCQTVRGGDEQQHKQHSRRAKQLDDGDEAEAIYFKSGFLGMDNICAFDRSRVPEGCRLYQADAYAWVFSTGVHCLQLALATEQPEDEIAFWLDWLARLQRGFRHLDHVDGFCYDILEVQQSQQAGGSWDRQFVRAKSMVGLMPLTAVLVFDWHQLAVSHASAITQSRLRVERSSGGDRRQAIVSLLDRSQWSRVFGHLFPAAEEQPHQQKSLAAKREAAMVSESPRSPSTVFVGEEDEGFMGPFGVRMVSRWHRRHPLTLNLAGSSWTLDYEPGESRTRMYGGNSNWRGPVWLCMNYLLAQAALRMHAGGRPRPEFRSFARQVCQGVLRIFSLQQRTGRRPVHGTSSELFAAGGPWSGPEYTLFYEYFHGDTGRGCGASHQTGWTALVVKFAEMLHCRLTAV